MKVRAYVLFVAVALLAVSAGTKTQSRQSALTLATLLRE